MAGHQHRIYFFIRSMVYQPEDARDVLQDVNVILFRKKEQFAMGTNFTAWCFTIARYECLAYLARRKNIDWQTLDHGLIDQIADRAEERVDDVENWLVALEKCRRKLSEEIQTVGEKMAGTIEAFQEADAKLAASFDQERAR